MFDTVYFVTLISLMVLMATIYFIYLSKCNASNLKTEYNIINKSAKNILTNIDSKLQLYFIIGLTSIPSSLDHNYIATIFFLCIVFSFVKVGFDYKIYSNIFRKKNMFLNVFYKYLDSIYFTGVISGNRYTPLDEQEKYIKLLKIVNKQDYQLYEELLLVILNEDNLQYKKVINLIDEYDAINIHEYKRSEIINGLRIRFKNEVFKALNIQIHSK